jgi:TusA-related sulfurtransferase
VEETKEVLEKLANGGYVEVEVTDSGMMVYRFPEVLFGHEKHWSRGIESA